MCIDSQSELKHEVRKKHFIDNLSICPNTEFPVTVFSSSERELTNNDGTKLLISYNDRGLD
jgi:hypothetical protein